MDTLEDRMKDCERWKQAEKNFKNFKEMMKLVKQYPIKPMKQVQPSQPYTLGDLLPYL